jgi:hypothetical protein
MKSDLMWTSDPERDDEGEMSIDLVTASVWAIGTLPKERGLLL